MQAISLWQPWAQLVAKGWKQIETRSWPPPGQRIGQRIAIHAAKRKVKTKDLNPEEFDMSVEALNPGWRAFIPYGALVCTVRLVGAEQVDAGQYNIPLLPASGPQARRTAFERTFGDYSPGRWMWKLSDLRIIEPVPYRGQRGMFELDLDQIPEKHRHYFTET